MSSRPEIMVVAGDVSGDRHSAGVLKEIKQLGQDFAAYGMGGDELEASGVELSTHLREGSVVGITEAMRMLPRLVKIYRSLAGTLRRRRPKLLLLVDYPDMNLRLARRARRLGIAVCYYIVPQVWAWRTGRVRQLRENVDLSLCLFAFEEAFLLQHGVEARFVGHPMIDGASNWPDAEARLEARRALGLRETGQVIALLPGSRKSELRHHLEIFLKACVQLRSELRDPQFVLALGPGMDEVAAEETKTRLGLEVKVAYNDARRVLTAADLALTKSGTSTVEAALCGTPMVIGYRVAPLSYWLARRLIRCEQIGMANLLAGCEVFPELIQDELRPETLARAALRVLAEPPPRAVYEKIRESLGAPGSQKRAARTMIERFF